MHLHITQANYLIAEMALGCAGAVCKLVRREATEENLRVSERWVIRSFLGYDEVAELAEYLFARTNGCSMMRKIRKGSSEELAIWTLYGGWRMKDSIVLLLGRRRVAIRVVVGTMPVIFPRVGVL
jgi:hypothetical protein